VIRYRVSVLAGRLWRVAVLIAAGAIGVTSQAEAAIYYWHNSDPGYWHFGPMFPQRRQRVRHQPTHKPVVAEKVESKPQGPLTISISIAQQKLQIYDANGLFAEAPVSTGMPGHPTPMGVFSVIQKQKYHRSNIYSGAPMPYMQRITWSGVAMHAGVLPGHPASHGCIRMPMAFAVKMWSWTRMGARVIITPAGVTPESFSHSLLATVKVPPQPPAAEEPKPGEAAERKVEKAPEIEPGSGSGIVQAKIELRPGIGDGTMPTATADRPPLAPTQMRTADARNGLTVASPMASDATAEASKPAAAFAAALDSPKDSARAAEAAKVKAAKAELAPSRRAGQIAVFVSRKDSRLYVRQNFSPLFDVPVTIAPDERPLGTHVFTAQVDREDANVLHWSAVSLPPPSARAERRSEGERRSNRHRVISAVPVEMKPMPPSDSPAEALDRLGLPADVMARIFEAISTGGSIIVSDQGIAAGETGEGTDFIVSLR
jgi:lipoprotein-anchoring transpeptidase ErfK/SrfK